MRCETREDVDKIWNHFDAEQRAIIKSISEIAEYSRGISLFEAYQLTQREREIYSGVVKTRLEHEAKVKSAGNLIG